MIDVLIMTAQLVFALSILVGVHEFGHMITAKMFGMKVEKFFIGFPPKLFGFKKGETEYGIGMIPLGGFAKIAGMVDESLDTKKMNTSPEPWEFRTKPIWQRVIVMIGGVVLNLILGVVIYTFVVFYYGDRYITKDEVNKHGIVAYKLGEKIGFQTGDRVVKLNGKDFEKFNDTMNPAFLINDNSYYTVERGDSLIDIKIPEGFIEKLNSVETKFIEPITPFEIAHVAERMGAFHAKLQPNDRIVKLKQTPINYAHELTSVLQQNKGEMIDAVVVRGNDTINTPIQVSIEGTIGITFEPTIKTTAASYGFLESAKIGTKRSFSVLFLNIKALGQIFTGKLNPRKALSGPIGIIKLYGSTWVWEKFWTLTGMISMVLAFFNILPIPALDGGHVFLLTIEAFRGKPLPIKVIEKIQITGMLILLSLIVLITINDVINFF